MLHGSKQLHFKWNWQLHSGPRKLWPLVSDTNRLFKDVGLPTVEPADITHEIKNAHSQLTYNSIKYNDAWIEEPYEWEYPYRFSVNRTYESGAFKEARFEVDLLPNNEGTRLTYQIWITPRNNFFSYITLLKYRTIIKSRFKSAFRRYDRMIQQGRLPYEASAQKKLDRRSAQRLDDIENTLRNIYPDSDVIEKLKLFILKADDIDLNRIEPLKLVEHWNEDKREVLNVFFHAANEGLLTFNWDLYCPRCRTIQQRCKTLNEIHEPIFCHDCNHEFNTNFNRTIQLSFQPGPLIRKISNSYYCLFGPQEKPHVRSQQYLRPGEKKYLKTYLEEGVYQLRSSEADGIAVLKVKENGDETVNIRLTNFGLNGVAEITNQPNLIFENETNEDQLFILEEVDWDDQKLTAAQVTSLQLFRDLFSREVLQEGEKIDVNKLTLMFTDLFDSTRMYHKEGDSQALGRVIEHFEVLQEAIAKEDGALVKTIGDSIMAVFSNPHKAFKAFITAQEIISKDDRFGKSFKIKAGIHHGSCMAVNLNNKIDYFGSTVNIASRLADTAGQNEIVISRDVADNEHIQVLLEKKYNHFNIHQEVAHLKGIDRQFTLQRIQLEQSALRLVV